MQADARHHIDRPFGDLRQLLGEVVDLPPDPGPRRQLVEQVEIARRRGGTASR
jgi:hypothetical protein